MRRGSFRSGVCPDGENREYLQIADKHIRGVLTLVLEGFFPPSSFLLYSFLLFIIFFTLFSCE